MYPCSLPPPLQPGDRLVVIAPSGTLREVEQRRFEQGLELWRSQGYQVDLCPGYDDTWGYLAGTDGDRRQQLLSAWSDPTCQGILCARGGYGGARLLEGWDWGKLEPIAPKWFIGFSDITALLWSFAGRGIAGVHGPVLTTVGAEPEESRQRLFDWVAGQRELEALSGQGWGGGTVTGILLPGNLTVATHLLGTAVQPSLEGVILALEDVGEAPYRIDRLLTQWRMTGALAKVRGIALGRFSACVAPATVPSFTIEQVLRDRLGDLPIPIVSDLPFGHDGENAALPVGLPVALDGDRGQLRFDVAT